MASLSAGHTIEFDDPVPHDFAWALIAIDATVGALRRLLARRCPACEQVYLPPPEFCSGVSVPDVDVIELHDCFSVNEIITYEALGLCAEGKGGHLAESGATTYGGQCVVTLYGKGPHGTGPYTKGLS